MNNTANCVALKLQSNQFQFDKDNVSDEKEGINGLPGEVLYKIFSDLPLQSLVGVNSVSKRWNKIENNRLITLVFLSCIEGEKIFINLLEEFKSYFDMFFPKSTKELTKFLEEPKNVILVNMLLEVFMANSPQVQVSDILKTINDFELKHSKENCEMLIPFSSYLLGIQKKNHITTMDEAKVWYNELTDIYKHFFKYSKEDFTGFNYYLMASLFLDFDKIVDLPNKEEFMRSLLVTSAMKGFNEALRKLGDLYYLKENPSDEDKSKAYNYYKLAADHKCVNAYKSLIIMATRSEIVLSNEDFCSYSILAANNGKEPAWIRELGLHYLLGLRDFKKNVEKGLHYLEEAATSEISAAKHMCSYYSLGIYTEKNQEKAEFYFNIVKNLSLLPSGKFNPKCVYELANLFENGHGVRKDLNLAKTYYELSAKSGKNISLYTLGNLIEEGNFSFDKDQMLKFYTESADKGHPTAQFKMCQIYSEGLYGIPEDSEKAIHYFKILNKKTAINYEASQKANIALCYLHGFGVKKDVKMAYEYFHKAADLGHANAQYKLSLYYSEQNDLENTEKYFKLLSDKHHVSDLFRINERYRHISYCYANGIGTPKDENKAALYKQMEIDTGARFLSKSWL